MKIQAALKNPNLWPWLVIIPTGIIYLWRLGNNPLWYDEAVTVLQVKAPWPEMMQAIVGDFSPPLYFVIIRAYTALVGFDPFLLRLPSVLFVLLALWELWKLSENLHLPEPVGVIGMVIFAMHPNTMYYAQEARMYGLLVWLVISQANAMLNKKWWLVALLALAGMYTNYYAIFYTAGIAVTALVINKYRLVPVVLSYGLAGVGYLPWAGVLIKHMQHLEKGYWIPPLSVGSALTALYTIYSGHNMLDGIQPLIMFCSAVAILLAVVAGFRNKQFLLLVMALSPIVGGIVLSIVWQPVLHFRSLFPTIAVWGLLAGLAIYQSKPMGRVVTGALIFPFLLGFIWQFGYTYIGWGKSMSGTMPFTPPNVPLIHLEETTAVDVMRPDRDLLLDTGCPAMDGGLSDQTKTGLGYKTIGLAGLPKDFYLAAYLGPFSTKCHEILFHQLTDKSEEIYHVERKLTIWGVWHVTENR